MLFSFINWLYLPPDIFRTVKEGKKGDWLVNLEWMWHEKCSQGYQKCDRHVYRVIRYVTCVGLSEMWHETCAQGYQKCDMRRVHRVIRNVTCTGLSEMRHAQGYQKCDRHMHGVIRNVIWDMCTRLSEILNHNEQSTPLSVAVMFLYTKLQRH